MNGLILQRSFNSPQNCTVTVACLGAFHRRAGSWNPTFTVSVMSRRARRLKWLGQGFGGTRDHPRAQSLRRSPDLRPACPPRTRPPEPLPSGMTAIDVLPNFNASAMLGGATCTTSTPNGTRTCSGVS